MPNTIDKTKFLENEKISKLLLKLSTPAIVGMVIMSFYQVVDAIFIGQGVGTLGIAAVAIVIPISMFMMAIAQMIGIGISSIISRSLGEKDFEKTKIAFGNFLIMIFILSIIITVIGIYFLDNLLILFGASSNIMPFAKDYMGILFFGTVFLMFTMSSNNIIRAQGHAKTAMSVMMVGGLFNLILTPIFVFKFGWGMRGAALSTVIGQILTSLYVISYYFSKRNAIKLNHLKYLKLKLSLFKETIGIGLSSFSRQVSASILAIIINNLLVFYGGDIAIAAYGVINRVMMVIIMPMFGVVQGMLPILGFNYGAKKYLRVKEVLFLSIKYASVLAIIPFILLFAFPDIFVKLFTSDVDLINFTVPLIRIIFLFFPLVGFYLIISGIYQAMGKIIPGILLSLLRQTILLIPLVLVVPIFFGLKGIFYAFPISDLLAGIISYLLFRREMKKIESSISSSN